jgi:phosphoglycerate dehydrogenase-like enzyme
MHRLLVTTRRNQHYLDLLRAADLPDLTIVEAGTLDEGRSRVADCDLILGEPGRVAPILDAAEKLVWVQSTFAGVETLCAPGLRRDYRLTGVKGIFGLLMSEYVFAYILALERRLFELRNQQERHEWRDCGYRRLRELTLGICGLGDIGRHIAATANHFGMYVVGYKRTPGHIESARQVFSGDQWGTFLSLCDYLVLVLPDTSETRGLIDITALKQMKPSAVIINIGRGSSIVEKDLVRALAEKTIRAAVLDVFESEPLPAQSSLWKLPNLYISPHNAGRSFADDIVPIFCDNYRRFLAGTPLRFGVDFDKGY